LLRRDNLQQPEVSPYKNDAEVILIEVLSHMGVVVGPEVRPHVKVWMANL